MHDLRDLVHRALGIRNIDVLGGLTGYAFPSDVGGPRRFVFSVGGEKWDSVGVVCPLSVFLFPFTISSSSTAG